ncbi:FGGY-family carbohydrate kinase [uncultured Massilia sp.]|uniref:FGGY-family carbohydrate kinase n=1 Tax=uncultured Massilia sp. TaxID=169973 RepID=UPI0025E263A5|nr:FGGY-family carbohydrate kinase [uncultured Massilia sp.]
MTPEPLILAIDNGTQSVRALLFDPRGRLVAGARVALDGYVAARPGWSEHDPEAYWHALCRACRALWAQDGARRDAVQGVALTTQRGTVVNLDRAGRALRPAITWLDQRRAASVPPLRWWWRAAFRAAGVQDTVDAFRSAAEINWIHAHQPEVWRATDKFLLLSGYLNWRLCGRFADSSASQVGYVPFDYRRQCWAGPRDWKWQALALEPRMLPELVAPGGLLGAISAQAAAATGIPAGTPLLAAAADKACEALGAGCSAPHLACLSYGTTATVNVTGPRYVEAARFVPAFPAAVPGAWNCEAQVFRGYWMVEWFKREFGHPEQQRALREDLAPEHLFDALADTVPPGSMGLVLQPYWTPGIRVPGREAKGAVVGFGDVHGRAHVYRAILEGVAYALREGLERIERRGGARVTGLRVAGGGAQSDCALQLTADVFGLPAARPHVHETSGLGAAIAAAVGLGLHRDVAAAVGEMTRAARVFEPVPAHSALYERLYRRVYLRMYARLKPLYDEIAAITGYPQP